MLIKRWNEILLHKNAINYDVLKLKLHILAADIPSNLEEPQIETVAATAYPQALKFSELLLLMPTLI